MVNINKLKKKSRLGTPPSSNEIKNNLHQPEVLGEAIDRRTLRKTGRTHQLAAWY
jgi:ribosomal protein S8E